MLSFTKNYYQVLSLTYLFLCIILTGTSLYVPASNAQTLQNIRVGLYENHTRIVIQSDVKFPYRIFTLDNPNRLIVDMPNLDWQVEKPPSSDQSKLIKQSRYGLFRPDVLRLVLDLSSSVRIKHHRQYIKQDGVSILILDIEQAADKKEKKREIIEKGWQEYLAKSAKDQIAQAIKDNQTSIPEGVVEAPLPKKLQRFIVMIDPGHGGIDPGAVSMGKKYEKDVVLQVARKLQNVLQKHDVIAKMTRNKDYYVPLAERFRKAERAGANLFISLHADAAENPRATGASVYTLSDKASDKEAAKLAKKENASDILVGVADIEEYDPAVQFILLSMSQRITQRQSTMVAKHLLPKLAHATKLKSHAHRSAGFLVLKSPVVPSILIELGYMSNKNDLHQLMLPDHQQKLAEKIGQGVMIYLETQRKK